MNVLCIDVGNTFTHIAVVKPDGVDEISKIQTREISMSGSRMAEVLDQLVSSSGIVGVSFCSVVPGIYPHLIKHLRIFTTRLFNLTAKTCIGMNIDYPDPNEIGQDRLANGVGAQAKYGTPSVVIDMGTAVTFDVVSGDRGYEGGVIAPGLNLMSNYLHEKTALLPQVHSKDWKTTSAVGKSTKEAIGIGCRRGFQGMVRSLLEPIKAELKERTKQDPKIVVTGGDTEFWESVGESSWIMDPHITHLGLYEAFKRWIESEQAKKT